jgi:hypothetical protein
MSKQVHPSPNYDLFHPSKRDREIEAELRSHIETRTADNIATGLSPEEAGIEPGSVAENRRVAGSSIAVSVPVVTSERQSLFSRNWKFSGRRKVWQARSIGWTVNCGFLL